MKVPPGASGSSTRSANDAVLPGASSHASGGDWSAPSQVNCTGIGALFWKPALESAIAVSVSRDELTMAVDLLRRREASQQEACASSREASAPTRSRLD